MLPNHVETNPSPTKPNNADNHKPTFPPPKPPKPRQEQPQTTNGTKPRHRKPRCDTHPPLPQPLERRPLRRGDVEGVVGLLLRPVPRRGAGLLVPVVVKMPGRRRRRRPTLLHFARTYEIRKGDDTEVSSRSQTLAGGRRPLNTAEHSTDSARASDDTSTDERKPEGGDGNETMETKERKPRGLGGGGEGEKLQRSFRGKPSSNRSFCPMVATSSS